MRGLKAIVAGAALAWAGAAGAQMTPQQAEIVAGDPPMTPQQLALAGVPQPTGPFRYLFNGLDLSDWEYWLGYADPSLTFRGPGVAPLGTSLPIGEAFRVVLEDRLPAIRAGGRYWGSLMHTADLADYHLSLEYKWGALMPGEERNNGLVYHSQGAPGAVFGTWMAGVEFQLQHGNAGMVIPMGNMIRARMPVGQDLTIAYPYRRFWIGGRDIELANGNPAYSVAAAIDAEKPVGEWNRIDLYVVGDRAVQVVNGVPVMELRGLATVDAAGNRTPLTHGRIQLQSEGAVTFFRNVRIEPIRALPIVVLAQP